MKDQRKRSRQLGGGAEEHIRIKERINKGKSRKREGINCRRGILWDDRIKKLRNCGNTEMKEFKKKGREKEGKRKGKGREELARGDED